MRKILLVTATLGALVVMDAPSLAQGIRIGPGGVDVDDGRGYREERDERRYRRLCRELRDACENKDIYGEEGRGNCRRYRRTCG
jgi:cytochrome c-type biogenesis protein CcmH/NrfF